MHERLARMNALSAERRTLLVRRLAELAHVPAGPAPLPRQAGVNVFRTSFAQERVWFLEQVAAGSAAYTVAGAFEAQGRLDVAALRSSLAAVIARHETLRTTFVAMDGRPMQVISPVAPVGMVVRDLRAQPCATSTEPDALRVAIRGEVERPFDLSRGPLLRLCVLVADAERHLIVLTMHHLIADAWSVGILVRELSELYRAAVDGGRPELEGPVLQYADYSEWQRRRSTGTRHDALVAYWRAQLTGAPYPTVASGDRLAFRGSAERCDLGPRLAAALRETARRAGVTPFVVALAAWNVVLGRWAHLDDVTVLSPVANRERSELADIVGFFVNLIALRTPLGGDPPASELLRRVADVVQDGLRHQVLPFEVVLSVLDMDRTLARPPLSPFAFAWERPVDQAIDLPDVALTPVPLEVRASRTDLALIVCERDSGWSARLEYDRSLYDGGQVARLLDDFRICLEHFVDAPGQRISTMLPSESLPSSIGDVPAGTVWGRFVAQAHRTPRAVAVRAGSRVVTYEALDAQAARLAVSLAAAGAETDTVIAVLGERGLGWVQALLGIWGCGGVYLPLDPRWPSARIEEVLERSDARFVLVDGAAPDVLMRWSVGGGGRRLVRLDDASDPPAATVVDVRGPEATNVAYVLYTSGSTGTPKGALIEHAGLANHLAAKIDLLALDAGDRVAQTAAASFDVSLWQLLAPLLVGAEVVVLDDATATDPVALATAVARHHITVLEIVPSVLQLLLDAEAAGGGRGWAGLRWLLVTGEALPPELCRRWLARHPSIAMVNAYGPTECADDVTHHVVATPPPPDATRVPIGRPIAGMSVHVMDDRLVPVAPGDAGEICVSGVGVGRGYLGDPERTAAAFVTPIRADGSHGPRLYRTGDRGRWRADGTLEWLGRLDAQVKIRGVRVEPEEVEVVLAAHPRVRRAAVIAEPVDAPVRLIAYVETEGESPALAEELRAFVAARVPEAMVPARFVAGSALPRTANGKLDRRALAAGSPRVARVVPPADARAPETPVERLLAMLWREVLGVEVHSAADGFFALGGDSLSTIRLVAAARRHGLVFTPQHVFAHQTIAALAAVAATNVTPSAEQGLVVGDVEPTPIQRLLLTADLPNPDHYNMSMLLAVEGRLTPGSLTIAVEHLIRHHDALRIRVRGEQMCRRMTIAGLDGTVPHAHLDLSALADAAATAAIESGVADAQSSLDLARGPLLRVLSFDLGPQRPSRLAIVVHHLACDAASWPILLEDLAAVYEQVEHGAPIALPAKTSSYRTWSERLSAYARTDACRREGAFWARECTDAGARLPRVRAVARPAVSDVATVVVTLEPDPTARLIDAMAERGATIETALLTALVTTMTAGGSEQHMLVYLERHGREVAFAEVDVSRTVGWFTTVFPVRVEVAPSRRPGDTLAGIARHLRTIPTGGVAWGLLGYGSDDAHPAGPGRPLARPEVSCNYLGRIDPPREVGWTIAPESPGAEVGPGGTRPTTLDVVASIASDRLHVAWHYDAAAHARAAIAALAAGCLGVLRGLADAGHDAVAADPGRSS